MLTITVDEQEFFDQEKQVFFTVNPVTVRMEHSLISISKWEAHWEKPFLSTAGVVPGMEGAAEEIYYIQCMILGGAVPTHIPEALHAYHNAEISAYMDKKHSATTINRFGPQRPSRNIITSELIYYWMIKFGIPIECHKWHFNRLLMLIDVCSVKEMDPKYNKMSPAAARRHMTDLNRKRRGL
jgi:hypothetical protein